MSSVELAFAFDLEEVRVRLAAVEPEKAQKILDEIDTEYEGRHTDPRWTRMAEGSRR